MTEEVRIVVVGEDKASGPMNKVVQVTNSFDAALYKLIQHEKEEATQKQVIDKFNKMTAAEKEAFIAAQKLVDVNERQKFSFTELNSVISLVSQGLRYAQQAYAATIGEAMKYDQQIRDLVAISGQGAEATSRFVQVLDDYQITVDDVTAATRALTKQGLAPTIETLAKLSDQYNALNTVEEKNEFVIKNLGRSGLQWVNVLKAGSTALLEQGDAVNKNLIPTDEMIKKQEQYRLTMDEFGDTVQGLKVSVGNEWIPILNDVLTATNNNIEGLTFWEKAMRGVPILGQILFVQDLKKAHEENATALDAATQATDANTESVELNAEELRKQEEATTSYYKGLISSVQSAQSEYDSFRKKTKDLADQEAELDAQYIAGKINAKDYAKQTADLSAKIAENAEAHKKWAAQTVFAFAQARAAADGNITKGEGDILIAMGQQLGLFDEQTAKAMEGVNQAFEDVDASNAASQISAVNMALQALTGHTWNINVAINTTGSLPSDTDMSQMPNWYAMGGQVKRFAPGGFAFGSGTSTSDSIPALLSRGEYVMRAAAVQKIGVNNLEAMNQGRSGTGGGPYIHADNINIYGGEGVAEQVLSQVAYVGA